MAPPHRAAVPQMTRTTAATPRRRHQDGGKLECSTSGRTTNCSSSTTIYRCATHCQPCSCRRASAWRASSTGTISSVATARDRTPACIILDLYMPGRSGIEVLRDIDAWNYPAPVFIASGRGDISKRGRGDQQWRVRFLGEAARMPVLLDARRRRHRNVERLRQRTVWRRIRLLRAATTRAPRARGLGADTGAPPTRRLREISTSASGRWRFIALRSCTSSEPRTPSIWLARS